MDIPSVVNRFLEACLADRERGVVRRLEDYQADFPGYEDLIAREFAELEAGCFEEHAEEGLGEVGPYRLLSELGRGGQGAVYLAEDRRLGRRVALKVLTGLGALDKNARARLLREAELASRLEHPSICTVYESGEHRGAPYVAMRLIDGGTLADELARRRAAGALPDAAAIRSAAQLVEETARAVHAAHEAGIVHRDLKPGNIALQQDGSPVVLDFGLARDEDGLTLTRTGDLFGTPTYMAPEQVEGTARSDPRTDVYALGVVLHECLTLQPPYSAPTRAALFRAIQVEPPPDPRRINPSVATDLQVITETAMQKERERRYRSALELADDLRRFLASEPILARPVSTFGRIARWIRREPWKAALVVLLAVGLPAAGAFGGYLYATSVADVLATGQVTLEQQALDESLARGYLVLLGGAAEQALPHFEEILASHSGDPEALTGAVLALVRTERDAEASSLLDRAEREGADARVVSRLRSVLGEAGGSESGRPVADADYAALFAGAMSELATAPIWREAEAASRALDLLTRAAFLAPRPRPHVVLGMAQAAYRAGDGPAAERAADTLERLWPASPVARWGVAVALAPFDAERSMAVQTTLLADANLPDALRAQVLQSRGFTLGQLRRHEEAVLALEEAVACNETPQRLLSLGIERREAGDLEGSVAALQRAVELDPEYDRAHYNLGIDYRALGRDDLAEAAYREAVRLRPDHSFARNNLGNLLLDAGRSVEAEEQYRLSLRHQPRNTDTLLSLGRCLLQQEGRHTEALSVLFRMLALSQEPAISLWSLARDLDEGGIGVPREQLIEALYQAAVDVDPGLAAAWNDYGFFRVRPQGDMAGAYEAFRFAAFHDPANSQYRRNMVLALSKLGRWPEARSTLEELREQAPGVPGVALQLADFLVSSETPEEHRDPKAARSIATNLLGEVGGHQRAFVLLTLGRAHAQLGDDAEAERALRRALDALDATEPPPPQADTLRAALERELTALRGG